MSGKTVPQTMRLSMKMVHEMIRFASRIGDNEQVDVSTRAYANLLRRMLEDKKAEMPRGFSVVAGHGETFDLVRTNGETRPDWQGFRTEALAWRQARREALFAIGRQRRKRRKS